jgi:hypothetical protein
MSTACPHQAAALGDAAAAVKRQYLYSRTSKASVFVLLYKYQRWRSASAIYCGLETRSICTLVLVKRQYLYSCTSTRGGALRARYTAVSNARKHWERPHAHELGFQHFHARA